MSFVLILIFCAAVLLFFLLAPIAIVDKVLNFSIAAIYWVREKFKKLINFLVDQGLLKSWFKDK